MSLNEGILEEYHLSTHWVSCHWLSHLRQSHGRGLPTALPLYLKTEQIQAGIPSSAAFAFWLQYQHFLLSSFLIPTNCGRWKTKKRTFQFVFLFISNSCMAGRWCPQPSSPRSLSEPSAQPWSAEVPDHTSGSCFQSRREKTPAKNGSFWLRTAATLYGGIKRLMDPGQWSLEEQIIPFSADPALLARAAISKLWKKQLERESSIWQQSGARTDFQRSKNLKSAWQKAMTRSRTPLQLYLSLFTNL